MELAVSWRISTFIIDSSASSGIGTSRASRLLPFGYAIKFPEHEYAHSYRGMTLAFSFSADCQGHESTEQRSRLGEGVTGPISTRVSGDSKPDDILGDDSDLEMIIVVGRSPAVALETRAIWSWQSNCSRLLLLILPNVGNA
jgi:hypothetical protein